MGMVKGMRCDLCSGLWNGDALFGYWFVSHCFFNALAGSCAILALGVLATAFPE